ncbi:SCO-spondin-like [Penaeus indicus]|uniref:SCO-spondin-like n=1 Tax=Penaeus indicus TaxID=29960 RepID=UPI00300C536D
MLSPFGIDSSDLSEPFRCDYGGCIPSQFMCNGHLDCWDGSDETQEICLHHNCPKRTFKCKYGGCLKRLQVCDGKAQCFDGSDEDPKLCAKKSCFSRHFQCSYGACIKKHEKCDGVSDCSDSSDETPELCGSGHTFTKTDSRLRIPADLASFLNPQPPAPSTTQPTTTTTNPPPPPTTTTQPTTTTTQPTTTTTQPTTTTTQPTTTTTQPTTTTTQPPPPPPTTGQPPSPSLPSTDSDLEAPFPYTSSFPGEDVLSCDGVQSCPCPPPLQHFCIPCNARNETCARIGEEKVCLMPYRSALTGIEVEVLSCGANPFLSMAGMVRADRECGTNQGVPVLTVVTADCWGATTLIAECQADGLWHPYGEPKSAKPMRHLCQPHTLNADVCGKRARYVRPPGRYVPYETASLWPWLAGLFRREKYACTAALVSPSYLLTAAHCLTRSQETSQETVDLRDLRVQHLDERGNVIKGYHIGSTGIWDPSPISGGYISIELSLKVFYRVDFDRTFHDVGSHSLLSTCDMCSC